MNSNLNIQAGLTYDFGWSKILKGLKLRFTYSKSISTDKTNQYGSTFDIYTMTKRTGSGQHLYTPIAGEDYAPYIDPSNMQVHNLSNGDAQINRTMLRSDNYQMNFTASYNRDFGLHSVGALFSIEKSQIRCHLITDSQIPLPVRKPLNGRAASQERCLTSAV